jgi:hypothetical protein
LRSPDERLQDKFRDLESNPHVFVLNTGIDDCHVEMDNSVTCRTLPRYHGDSRQGARHSVAR